MLECVELDFEADHMNVMQLCAEIFGNEEDDSNAASSSQKARSLDVWKNRFHNMNGLLLGARENNSNQIVAFMFLYHKLPSQIHIWLAGTHQDFRCQGAMSMMFKHALAKAKERASEKVTLNTYPDKFPGMFRIATTKWGMTVVHTLPDGKVNLELQLV